MSEYSLSDASTVGDLFGYRVKRMCELVLNELRKIELGEPVRASSRVLGGRLFRLSKEAAPLSVGVEFFKSLIDVMAEVTEERRDLIQRAKILVGELLTLSEPSRYNSKIQSLEILSDKPVNRGFLSQRMQTACLVSDIREINRKPIKKRREFNR